MIQINQLSKNYYSKKASKVEALKNITLSLPSKGMIFLVGKSGCGKTTFLNVLGALDSFDNGDILISNRSMKDFSEQELDAYRNLFVGFVFQEYNLLEDYSVEKNISFALDLQQNHNQDISNVLNQTELSGLEKRLPNELSGGQKQRVAIARALIKKPKMLLCDEPTGSLDYETSRTIFQLLKEISKERLVIVVSHDKESALEYGDRIIEMRDGIVIKDSQESIENDSSQLTLDLHKLSTKNIFKLSKGFLKKRPGRLCVSIILSLIAFVLLGVSNSIASYDKHQKALNSIYENDVRYLAYSNHLVKENDYGVKENAFNKLMDDKDVSKISQRLNTNKVHEIYFAADRYASLNWPLSVQNDYSYLHNINGFIEIDNEFIHDYGYELYGNLPRSNNEIVITKLAYTLYQKFGYIDDEENIYEIKSPQDMLHKYLTLSTITTDSSIYLTTPKFYITGILDTKFNEKRYQLIQDPYLKGRIKVNLENELRDCLENGSTHNSVYVKKGYYREVFSDEDFIKSSNLCQVAPKNFVGNSYFMNGIVANEESYKNLNIYWMPGKNSLKENEVLLSKSTLNMPLIPSFTILTSYINKYVEKNFNTIKDEFLKDHPNSVEPFYFIDYTNYILNETKDSDNKYEPGKTYHYFVKQYGIDLLESEKFFTENIERTINVSHLSFDIKVVGYYDVEFMEENSHIIYTSPSFLSLIREEVHNRWNHISYVITPITHNKKTDLSHLKLADTIFKDEEEVCEIDGIKTYQEMRYGMHNDIYSSFYSFEGTFNIIVPISTYAFIVLVFFMIIFVYYYFSGVVIDKQREIGILRALGVSKKDIIKVFIVENILIATFVVLLSSTLTGIIIVTSNKILMQNNYLLIPILNFTFMQVLWIILIEFITILIGILIPSIQMMKKKPVDIIHLK